ncbi:PREDICTED: uncharacterized protein LOC106812936 [Priapulus caudatus]|uniref:Uncharacterized protein LOC106812936 n=1 Tax=Priapulus caudatus TaxID=37621 RepID=A0ABM1EJR1_PRICU|nr:PREDICTED: uncharacterized protein LOC106812936 [Priapulus caudatus]
MAELEQKLQAERNEHVKAVAELIQLEEQIVTERDSSSASVKRLECQLGQELDGLRSQLAAIVTERNALLTNARQEGMQLEPQSNMSQPTEPCSPAESDKT